MAKEATSISPLRRSARLMLLGQAAYIVVTQFHVGGDANDHSAIFPHYAGSGMWNAVHLAQFAAMTLLLLGLTVVFSDLRSRRRERSWVDGAGAACAAAALALYGALQAVDGVALKHAVTAWTTAPDAERSARFATAEGLRWLEWGMRSYHDIALAVALLLLAVAMARSAAVPRLLGSIVSITAAAYFVQGWTLGAVGFTAAHSAAIVIGWLSSITWMTWLMITARRLEVGDVSQRGPRVPSNA